MAPEIQRNREAWFRVDDYGWNAVPINGKGWRLIGLYLAVLLVWTLVMFFMIERSATSIILYVIGDLIISAGLVVLIFQRTEGQWWWQRRRK